MSECVCVGWLRASAEANKPRALTAFDPRTVAYYAHEACSACAPSRLDELNREPHDRLTPGGWGCLADMVKA